ncbi:MAG: hypothetical protein QXP01_06750 [Candidatus Hadarchaeum sp.]
MAELVTDPVKGVTQQQTPPSAAVEATGLKTGSQDTAQVATTAPDQRPVEQQDQNVWEQRYRTLYGKYNAEVPRLQAEIRNLRAAIEEMRKQMEKSAKAANKPPLISEKEKEELGDVAQVIERVGKMTTEEAKEAAKEVIEPIADDLRRQLAELKHQVFLRELTALEPHWATINQDLSWLEWLGQPDPLTGITRQVLLDRAVADGDAQRAAMFFRQWKAEVGKAYANTGRAPTLGSLVQPVAVPASSEQAAVQKPTYTLQDIKKLELDVARGRISATEARKALDEILAAIKEGRVMSKVPTAQAAV